MPWADLMLMLGNYEDARSLYRRIQFAARKTDDGASAVRAALAEAHLYSPININGPCKEHETRVEMTQAFIKDFPKETQLIENLQKHDKRVRRLLEVGFDDY